VKQSRVFALASVALFSLALAGCKQGAGERCQVTADCVDGLQCSNSDPKICVGNSSDNDPIDALPPVLIDAGVDAPPDGP
jgi:hypothetical protein